MTAIASVLMSTTSVGFSSSTVRLPATVGLRRLVSLRRRSLRMRLRHRPILGTRDFHALLRLRLRTVFHSRLRLHPAVFYPWSLHPRLRLWLSVIFESRLSSVRLWLRMIFESRL